MKPPHHWRRSNSPMRSLGPFRSILKHEQPAPLHLLPRGERPARKAGREATGSAIAETPTPAEIPASRNSQLLGLMKEGVKRGPALGSQDADSALLSSQPDGIGLLDYPPALFGQMQATAAPPRRRVHQDQVECQQPLQVAR